MADKYTVYEDAAGKFRFRLKAVNGTVVASGHGYATKASAERGARSILRAAEDRDADDTAESGTARVPEQHDRRAEGSVVDPSRKDEVGGTGAPVRRQFRFAGGMSADADLAARSGEILRDELGREE